MLSEQEIIRQLRAIRFSSRHERNARRAPSMHGIAQATGISRMHIYRVAVGGKITPRMRQELSHVLTCNKV